MAIRLGDSELEALQLASLEFGRLYMHLRSQMDYRTGVVGVASYLSYQTLIGPLSWRPPQGSRRPGWLPSVRELRSLVDEGIRLGLLKRYSTQASADERRLVLLLVLADRDMAVVQKSPALRVPVQCGPKYERQMSVTDERHGADASNPDLVRVAGNDARDERQMTAGDERQSISGYPERYLANQSSSHTDDGGGDMSSTVIESGVVNNLFGDISTVDTTLGRVNLRKFFAVVGSSNADMLYGAHLIISEQPVASNIGNVLFSATAYADERAAAQNKLENYLVRSTISRFVMYGDHLTGSRMLRVYTDPDVDLPDVGTVYCLSVEASGYAAAEQYVRITKHISNTLTTLIDADGNSFQRQVMIFGLDSALKADFAGGTPGRSNTAISSPTKVRDTQIADAAVYYGCKDLAVVAAAGDMQINVGTPYQQIVPTTQSETAMIDVVAGLTRIAMVQSGAAGSLVWSGSLAGTASPDYAVTRYLGSALARGSLSVTIGAITLSDDGDGGIVAPSGNTAGWGGAVDYATGAVTITKTSAWSGAVSIAATPAAPVAQTAYSWSVDIGSLNRQLNYVASLAPAPAPGTLSLDYRSLGNWIRLADDGKGNLAGRTGEGTGLVTYSSGSIMATLGALPDLESPLIYTWGSPLMTERADSTTARQWMVRLQLDQGGLSGATLSWRAGGVAKSAAVSATGVLSGDATGTLDMATGELRMVPAVLPDKGSELAIAISSLGGAYGDLTESFVPSSTGTGLVSFSLPVTDGPVAAGTVRITLPVGYVGASSPAVKTDSFRDNGAGKFVRNGQVLSGSSINYATGACTLPTDRSVSYATMYGDGIQPGVGYRNIYLAYIGGQTINVWYRRAASEALTESLTQAIDTLSLDLTPGYANPVLANSTVLVTGSHRLVDRDGQLYLDISNTTDAGTLAGAMDYDNRLASITAWPGVGGTANSVTVVACLTSSGDSATTSVIFRTSSAPLRAGSTSIRATRADTGESVSATDDGNGNFVAEGIDGSIDVTTGVIKARFGAMVAATGLEGEDWYSADDVQADGTIWQPWSVYPGTVKFNTVSYTQLPLDAELLGLDPVRLPQDGKVPVYREGGMVVIHHTASTTLPDNLVAGQLIDLPRNRLTWVKVVDSAGTQVPSDRYLIDLDAGVITMAAPLSLVGYSQPLVAVHRVEDMRLVSDVQITGELTLTRPVTHDFPAGDTRVSSVLAVGDMQARVSNLYDQTTWTSVWSDAVIGSEVALAEYNDALAPIEVTNLGTIEQRWLIKFTSSTAFSVIGEEVGTVATGDINSDLIPINPITAEPYFTLRKAGWGGGWASGNCLRFNTVAATVPGWLARTTLAGDVAEGTDRCVLEYRGDAN